MNAYLDPGSGSMLLGLFASGLAGIVVFIKTFGHRVVDTLAFWRKDDDKGSVGPGGAAAVSSNGAAEADAAVVAEGGPEPEGASSTT